MFTFEWSSRTYFAFGILDFISFYWSVWRRGSHSEDTAGVEAEVSLSELSIVGMEGYNFLKGLLICLYNPLEYENY